MNWKATRIKGPGKAQSCVLSSQYESQNCKSLVNFSCPNCDRNTLEQVPDEIVDLKCAVCGERIQGVEL